MNFFARKISEEGTDKDELKSRLASRPGKTIPANVVMGMISQLEEPTKDEGFNVIITCV